MSDGFSNQGVPAQEFSARDIMTPLGSSSAQDFGVPITTNDVKAGFNNIETVTLQASDGTTMFAEHLQLGVLSTPAPGQDVPPGETQARP